MRSTSLLVGCVVTAFATPAWGNFGDIFGYGDVLGQAGAGVAEADDAHSVFTNPAGYVTRVRTQLAGGPIFMFNVLNINRQPRAAFSETQGSMLGFAMRVPGEEWLARNVSLGFLSYQQPTTIGRIVAPLPSEPFFPFYEQRLARITVMTGLSVRILPTLSVGATVQFFGAPSSEAVISADRDGVARATVLQQGTILASAILGLRFAATPNITVALVFRQQFSVPYSFGLHVRGEGTEFDTIAHGEALFTPHTLVGGVSWKPDHSWTFLLDFKYALWSQWTGPYARVETTTAFWDATSSVTTHFADVWSVRAAFSYRGELFDHLAVSLRAGLGYESSPILDQTGLTNMVDNNKLIAGFGVSVEGPKSFGFYPFFRISAQLQHVFERRTAKDPTLIPDENLALPGVQTSNPGFPVLSGGGEVGALYFNTGAEF